MPGVIRTRVGYAGGTTPSPTYHNLADYSETIQMDYDPVKLSYQDLLDVFWESQSPPTYPPISRQYMSIIFYHDETQQRLAEESLKKQEEKLGKKLYVEILPDDTFHLAEDYHQKYRLRTTKLVKDELFRVYNEQGFVNSTAAARINGYLGGYGTREQYEREAGSFGLSDAARKELDRLVAMWIK